MNGSPPPRSATAFYTVADRRFFPGLVALLNSLRLVGHHEPLVVVDAGLDAGQRERLADQVVCVEAPVGMPAVFLAPVGPIAFPAEVAVLIDADIIVTRPLTELVESARAGRLVGMVDCPGTADRHHLDWGPALGIGPLRRQPYLNAGLLVVPESLGRRLYPPWTAGQDAVGIGHSRYGHATLDDPFYFADQDVLNAVLAACFEADELRLLPHRLAPHPPFDGVRVVDERHLTCRYPDGTEPFLLHHVLAKPWLKATRSNVYSQLLSRLLLGDDGAVRLDAAELPLRLREGRLAEVERCRASGSAVVRAEGRRQLGRFGVRTRLRTWRARHAAA